MEITFTRGERGAYETTARRDDGVVLLVPGGDRKFALPHDIAHYFVERELGLANGFWGRVARGAIFPGMKVLEGRQPPHAAERSRRSIREEEQQGVEAEVWVGVLLKITHEGLDNDASAARVILRSEWRPRNPERDLPDPEEVRRTCAALREAERQWQALNAGQTLTVSWPVGNPRKPRSPRMPQR